MDLIVKVQLPLATNDPDLMGGASGLVYDEERKHLVQQPLPPKVVHALGSQLKGFFRGRYNGAYWELHEKVGDQPW